jgi:hypothetical protein
VAQIVTEIARRIERHCRIPDGQFNWRAIQAASVAAEYREGQPGKEHEVVIDPRLAIKIDYPL